MSRILQTGINQVTNAYGNGHNGIDIVKQTNQLDSIIAHSDGTVIWTQTGIPNDKGSSGNRSYGNTVMISHSNGYRTLYAHLNSVEVFEGEKVIKGQKIGYMGNTGNSYGAHLHFEVRNEQNVRIDPTPYINADLPNLVTAKTPQQNKTDPINTEGLQYYSHVESLGDLSLVRDGMESGTIGFGLRLEGLYIDTRDLAYDVLLSAKAHIEGLGWLKYDDVQHDTLIGSKAQSKRLEAIELNMTGLPSDKELAYRVHVADFGYTPWVTGGFTTGSVGESRQIEAIQIVIRDKAV